MAGRQEKSEYNFFAVIIFAAIFCFLLGFILSGCSGIETKPDSEKKPLYNYKADMEIEIDGAKHDGVAAVKLRDDLSIKIVSKAKLDVLLVSTCQRFEKFERLDKNWFKKSGDTFTYKYRPSSTEKEKACPIYFQAFDKSGLTDWGYVAFYSEQKLPASSECNGKTEAAVGHAVCQTKAGLDQGISFDRKIPYVSSDDSCQLKRVSESAFRYRPSLGFCTAEFSDGVDFHALTALGFDEVFIRGD